MEQQTLIFLGTQGSGKGTQMALLRQFLQERDPERKVVLFEAGAELRRFSEESGYTQERVNASLKRGELQPSFISGFLMGQTFISKLVGNEHLIVDGFPRGEANFMEFDSAMKFYGRQKPTLVHISISDEEAIKRLTLRHRNDDTLESIRTRLSWTRKQVDPIIEQLRNAEGYRALEIDGERSIEEIHRDILQQLGLSATANAV